MLRRCGDAPRFPGKVRALFLTRRRRPEAPGPILEAKGQERRLSRPSGWSAKIRALALKKNNNNKQTKIPSLAGGSETRINPVGVATQKDLSPRGHAATRLQ